MDVLINISNNYFRSELNQQAENLETEIKQLEERISKERKEASKVEEIIENSGSTKHKWKQINEKNDII